MRLYDNAYKSNYEELKTYYPVWYRDVLEMDALWRILGEQLDMMQAGTVRAVDNCFPGTSDEYAISRQEEFLYITYDGSRTIDERRAIVSSFSKGNGHIGEKEIKDIVSVFTAAGIAVSLVGGTIHITIESDRFNFKDCLLILLKKIPAHLALFFTLKSKAYATYQIATGAVSFERVRTVLPPPAPAKAALGVVAAAADYQRVNTELSQLKEAGA